MGLNGDMATTFMLFFIKSAWLLRLKIRCVGKSEVYVENLNLFPFKNPHRQSNIIFFS